MQGRDTGSELELKVLLVGAPKSGKTSLVRRMLDKSFREEYVQTLGFDISVVPYGTYQGRPVKLHLWDVAGSQLHAQPCHHALIGQGAVGVMYVMDVTSRESLQAVDDWDHVLSKFLPAWTCKLLVGHKADLPAYVVNDEALSLYVAGASGFKGWCLTVGSSEYGDYDVAARRGAGGATSNVGGRYKGQSLSGEKQLSVSEAVRTLLGHVFRSGGAGEAAARPAGVLGLGASAGRATPLPSQDFDDALHTVELLGLGVQPKTSDHVGKDDGFGDHRSGEMFASVMEALLERGSGPDSSWRRGEADEVDLSAGRGVRGDGVHGGDLGWRCFAGRMGREEAEALLRGRPDGTFFVRRKGPSLLVLTYVALSRRPGSKANTPTSGGKHRHKGSPARLSSPPPPSSTMHDVFESPLGEKEPGRRATIGPGKDYLADNTTVQHALLVYDGGFFSDERGRLGKFPTIQELLKSKISALARYPLSFRRERDRYVLIDDDEHNSTSPSDQADSSTTSAPSSSSNPFAMADGSNHAGDAPVRGSNVTSLAPAVTGDLFGVSNTGGSEARSRARASSARNSPPPSPPPPPQLVPAPPGSMSPNVDTMNTGNPFEQALRGRRSTSTAGSGARRVSGDWVDSRTHTSTTRRRGEGPSSLVSSSAGGGWLEAAAAVEKAGTAPAGGARVNHSSGRPRGGSLSSSANMLVASNSFHGTAGRRVSTDRGSRKESLSSTDSAGSPPSARAVDSLGAVGQQRQNQQRWRGGGSGGLATSAMEVAAEAAAAKASARDHPDARRVEKRALALQALVGGAVAVLEQQLQPLITRDSSERCPRYSPRLSATSQSPLADVRGVHRVSLSSPLSTFSSPGDYAKSPESPAPQALGVEQQQRWVAAASEGSVTAPLVAAATLLMERAYARRQSLIGSVQNLRERAVALAVGEASAAGGSPATISGGSTGLYAAAAAAAADAVPTTGNGSSRSPLPSAPSSPSPSSVPGRQRFSGLAGVAKGPTGQATGLLAQRAGQDWRASDAPRPPNVRGLVNLSCCLDFERVLGEENDELRQEETRPLVGDDTASVVGSSVSRTRGSLDKGKPLSDSSMIAEGSFSGVDQGGEVLRFTGDVEAATRPATDTWPAVFEGVAKAEERGRELVGSWEAAGGALKETCEELTFADADQNMVRGLAAEYARVGYQGGIYTL